MANIHDALAKTAGDHRSALEWFRQRADSEETWSTIKAAGETGPLLVTQAKGIYKPSGIDYALSVRQTLDSEYADKDVVRRPDGSWVYPYFQENSDPSQRDRMFTNRGLVRCMNDGVPVGVLVQTKPKPGVKYKVLGLAVVRDWRDGYFILEGFSEAGTLHQQGEDAALDRARVATEPFDPAIGEDSRQRKLRQIAERKGQPRFRRMLLEAYGGRCAITGCDAVQALEAAHIAPYRGEQSDHPQNGLLLRSDLHTLFDLGLISVDPSTMGVVISPELKATVYRDLDGHPIAQPKDPARCPSAPALRDHMRWSGLASGRR